MSEGEFDSVRSPEHKEVTRVLYLGRLADFGLGNPEGIPSRLAAAPTPELEAYGESLLELLAGITDPSCDSCIDGRRCLHNEDGSRPEIRERFVCGSGANLERALNSGASLLDEAPNQADMPALISFVDRMLEQRTGKQRAAHTGGCGGANGAIDDNRSINANEAIMTATAALMDHPVIHRLTGASFVPEHGQTIRQRAGRTADYLQQNDWQGQAYVDGVIAENPRGVAVLATKKDPYHGHAEDAIVFVTRPGVSLDKEDVFVATVPTMVNKAVGMSGERSGEAFSEALVAVFAKHIATSDRLASPQTPLYIIA